MMPQRSDQDAKELWAEQALQDAAPGCVQVPLEELRELVALARYGPEVAGRQAYPEGSTADELLRRMDRLVFPGRSDPDASG